MLLPVRTGRFEGPGVFEIPVVFPPSRGSPADKWILDGSDNYGVRVVETPLATSLGLEQQARVGEATPPGSASVMRHLEGATPAAGEGGRKNWAPGWL